MNIEEFRLKFEKNVEYLRNNIPPDDIYMFTEQTFMAAMYFIKKWSECIDLKEQCRNDPICFKWVQNIMGLQICREKGIDIQLDLNLESIEKDD